MNIFLNLFKKKQNPSPKCPEHAVIVHFSYGQTDLQPIFQLEDELKAAISIARVGEYDGHEVEADRSEGTLFMYGPDGDKIFEVVKPILESTAFIKGATVNIRYGPPTKEAKEKQVSIDA